MRRAEQVNAPLLSICIPTHDGRAATLEQTLESVLAAVSADRAARVEICISDNASRDATADVVEGIRSRSPIAMRYRRHVADRGAAQNTLDVVELARGDYCWIVSSDDLLSPGAIDRVLELLDGHPGIVAMSVNLRLLDDRSGKLLPAGLPDIRPSDTDVVVYEGMKRILEELGLVLSGISQHVFDRRAWCEVARSQREHVLSGFRLFAHVAILCELARASPRWLWCPEPLICYRLAAPEEPSAPLMVRFAADLWRVVCRAGGREVAAAALSRSLELLASPPGVLGLRSSPEFRWRDHVRLTRLLLGHLRWVDGFWPEVAPALLLPRRALPVLRLLARLGGRSLRVAARLPGRVRLRAHVEVQLPGPPVADQIQPARVCLTSEGWPLLTWWPLIPLYVSYRWQPAGGGRAVTDGRLKRIGGLVRPGRTAELTVRMLTPPQPGTYLLTVGLTGGVGWLDERGSESAWSAAVTVQAPGAPVSPGPRTPAAQPVPRTAPSR